MKDFYLSHWKDAVEIHVGSNLAQKMKNHHFSGVRFLYNIYRKKFKGAILNYDEGMNFPWIMQIFLSTIFKYHKIDFPILILTPERDEEVWYYHMKKLGVNVAILSDTNCQETFNSSEASIILASLSNLNLIHPYRENKFQFVIADQFDSVAYKIIFKKLSGIFNIVLTHKDFLAERDQKLLWTMLNWTNPMLFGKFADFYETDADHMLNLRDPYDDVWHRLSWDFCEGFSKDTQDELDAYKKAIDDWKATNDSKFKKSRSPQRKTRKRKLRKIVTDENSDCSENKERENGSEEIQKGNKVENELQLNVRKLQKIVKDENSGCYDIKGRKDQSDRSAVENVQEISKTTAVENELLVNIRKSKLQKTVVDENMDCSKIKKKENGSEETAIKEMQKPNAVENELQLKVISRKLQDENSSCYESKEREDQLDTAAIEDVQGMQRAAAVENELPMNIRKSKLQKIVTDENRSCSESNEKENGLEENTIKEMQKLCAVENDLQLKVRKRKLQDENSGCYESKGREMKKKGTGSEKTAIEKMQKPNAFENELQLKVRKSKLQKTVKDGNSGCYKNKKGDQSDRAAIEDMKKMQKTSARVNDFQAKKVQETKARQKARKKKDSNKNDNAVSLKNEQDITVEETQYYLEHLINDNSLKIHNNNNTEMHENLKLVSQNIRDIKEVELLNNSQALVEKYTQTEDSRPSLKNTTDSLEDSDILLSIMEGKFSVSQINSESQNDSYLTESSNYDDKFAKHDSKTILTSLFGEEAECIEEIAAESALLEDVGNVFRQKNDLQLWFDFDDKIEHKVEEKSEHALSDEKKNALIALLFND